MSAVISLGTPDRGDQRRRPGGTTAARSRVREWQMRDRRVRRPAAAPPSACRPASSGRRRPPRRPRSSAPACAQQLHARPSGVHGHHARLALLEQPGVDRRQPVDVLERIDQRASSRRRRSAAAPAAAAGCRAPRRRRSATAISVGDLVLRACRPGSSWWNERMPASSVALRLLRDVDVRRRVVADQDRRQARLVAAAVDPLGRPRAATRSLHFAPRPRLPSMIVVASQSSLRLSGA